MTSMTRTTARAGVALALTGGLFAVVTTPALAASGQPTHRSAQHHTASSARATAASAKPGATAVPVRLGPAVAYTRAADGTVTRTR